jgi:hypothetical protein
MATNTIAGVNLAAIAEMSLPTLTEAFAPLRGIMTDFSSDIAQRGESVTTRFALKMTSGDLSSGYTASNNTAVAATITLNQFRGPVWEFSDFERSRSSIDLNALFIQPAVASIGARVWEDLWNLVNDTNFPAAAATELTVTAANFDRDDVADLAQQLTTNGVPRQGRSLYLNPSYYAALAKDLNSVDSAGQGRTLGENEVPRLHGFDVYETPLIDGNGVNVTGLACHNTALIMAARGVDVPANVAGLEVETVVVPDLGLPVQFRRWYEPGRGQLVYSMGVLYGVASAMGTAGSRPAGVKIVSS